MMAQGRTEKRLLISTQLNYNSKAVLYEVNPVSGPAKIIFYAQNAYKETYA